MSTSVRQQRGHYQDTLFGHAAMTTPATGPGKKSQNQYTPSSYNNSMNTLAPLQQQQPVQLHVTLQQLTMQDSSRSHDGSMNLHDVDRLALPSLPDYLLNYSQQFRAKSHSDNTSSTHGANQHSIEMTNTSSSSTMNSPPAGLVHPPQLDRGY